MLTETLLHRASGALYQPVTEEGRALLDLIDEHLPAVRAGAADHDHAGTLPVDVIEAYGRNGVLGGTVPAELGGLGVRSQLGAEAPFRAILEEYLPGFAIPAG